jgi:gas vesicle protein
MSEISFSNTDLISRSYDKNKNGFVEELQTSNELKNQIDTNKDGQISTKEVSIALKNDSIEISDSKILLNQSSFKPLENHETLSNVRTLAKNAISAIDLVSTINNIGNLIDIASGRELTPKEIAQQNRMEQQHKLNKIRNMYSSLKQITEMTNNKTDPISVDINKQAKSAMASAFGSTVINSIGMIFEPPDSFFLNLSLSSTSSSLRSTLGDIERKTTNLPNIPKAVKSVDASISDAFSNIEKIKNNQTSNVEIKDKLYQLGKAEESKISNKAGKNAVSGAIVGGVVGGVVAYATMKNTKMALIGVGVGSAVTSAASALITKGIDKSHEFRAKELRSMGDQIQKYDVKNDEENLLNHVKNAYEISVKSKPENSISNRIIANESLNEINKNIDQIEKSTKKVLNIQDKSSKVK